MSEVGFANTALAHRNVVCSDNLGREKENTLFGNRKNERIGDEKLLIPRWPRGPSWYGTGVGLLSVTKGKSYQWNLKMDLTLTK